MSAVNVVPSKAQEPVSPVLPCHCVVMTESGWGLKEVIFHRRLVTALWALSRSAPQGHQ